METGIEKKLRLTNWREGVWFGKAGINFDVLEEDGKKATEKQFTVTSRRLLMAMKPVILKAEEKGRDNIAVSILRTGEGFDTRYTIKEPPSSSKDAQAEAVRS